MTLSTALGGHGDDCFHKDLVTQNFAFLLLRQGRYLMYRARPRRPVYSYSHLTGNSSLEIKHADALHADEHICSQCYVQSSYTTELCAASMIQL